MPEILDWLHLGEEAMASNVEPPAISFDSPADPSDHLVGLEDNDLVSALD